MALITFSRNDTTAITANFTRDEFQCPCGCNSQLIDDFLVKKLQSIRDVLDKPLKVTSGYRCMAHNKDVGGSTSSRHLYGIAADWRTVDRSINPVCLGILATQYFKGIGIYWYDDNAFVHTDTRHGKATWLCVAKGSYCYTSNNTFIMPTIKKGSVGQINKAAIKMLQRLLNISVTGTFDTRTQTALKNAQTKYGLTVDGICGSKSWKAISGAADYLDKVGG